MAETMTGRAGTIEALNPAHLFEAMEKAATSWRV
jgi:hypothetical protein